MGGRIQATACSLLYTAVCTWGVADLRLGGPCRMWGRTGHSREPCCSLHSAVSSRNTEYCTVLLCTVPYRHRYRCRYRHRYRDRYRYRSRDRYRHRYRHRPVPAPTGTGTGTGTVPGPVPVVPVPARVRYQYVDQCVQYSKRLCLRNQSLETQCWNLAQFLS